MPAAVLLNIDDPIFGFENMMQHRQYFAVMGDPHNEQGRLTQFSTLPYILDPVFDPDEPGWPWNFRHQQAHNDFNANLPANFNNGYSLTDIPASTVTGTGDATVTAPATTTNIISISALSDRISNKIGATITGSGVSTTITSQISGPDGGNGDYMVNPPVNAMTALALSIHSATYVQANPQDQGFGIQQAGILIEGVSESPENRSWWTFLNHQQHFIANAAILPLPTQSPTSAGTGPGQITASNPWWWLERGPVIFPYW
jgi:hypothetical protein